MGVDDLVERETPVFTEYEVFVIAGYLAHAWGIDLEPDHVADVEAAIRAALNGPRGAG
jgi:hypothetical protein